MTDPLYGKDLLRLAANAAGTGRLHPCDAEGHAHNPTCGDKIGVTLQLDAAGRIKTLALETKACVLSQASASILGNAAAGSDLAAIRALRIAVENMLEDGKPPAPPFADYLHCKGAATFRNRHRCVLLPIDAVLNALENARR